MMHSLGHEVVYYGVGGDVMTVEYGIGYNGTFAKYRVFESYAHMHKIWGAQGGYDPGRQVLRRRHPELPEPGRLPVQG